MKYQDIGDIDIFVDVGAFENRKDTFLREKKTMGNEELLHMYRRMAILENVTRNERVRDYLSNGMVLDRETYQRRMYRESSEMHDEIRREVLSRMRKQKVIKLKIK